MWELGLMTCGPYAWGSCFSFLLFPGQAWSIDVSAAVTGMAYECCIRMCLSSQRDGDKK